MSARLKFFVSAICVAVMIVFLCNVQRYSLIFLKGVSIWANNMLPTALPFMLLSGLVSKLGAIQQVSSKLSLGKALFDAPRNTDWIFVLSLLCGYPVGAKLIAEQFQHGLDKPACIKLATFCSTGSPIFMVGTVGANYLKSTKAGFVILLSHLIATVLNGFSYRKLYKSQTQAGRIVQSDNPSACVIDSVNSILSIGALVALFYTLCSMIFDMLPKWFSTDGLLATSFVLGLLEITTGCVNICQVADTFTATVLSCTLISFGGLCVILQMMTFLNLCKIKTSTIVITKVTHCAYSTIVCFVLGKLFAI